MKTMCSSFTKRETALGEGDLFVVRLTQPHSVESSPAPSSAESPCCLFLCTLSAAKDL